MRNVTNHAQARFRKRYGLDLPAETWHTIAKNARAGLYEKRRPRAVHPRKQGRKYGDKRGRSPVYLVPMGESPDAAIIVPMVIDTQSLTIITVLAPDNADHAHMFRH
jgi:hypothetical protein